jgi:hypothetical protein
MSSLVIAGDTSGSVTLQAPAIAGSTTITLPTTTGNAVVDTATQTLTNKTLTSPTITGAVVSSMASSVITTGTAKPTTSGTSVDFTGIPSWAKRIVIMYTGVSLSGTDTLILQLGTGGVPETTGYVGGGMNMQSNNSYGSSLCAANGFSFEYNAFVANAAYARSGKMIIDYYGSNTWYENHNNVLWTTSGQTVPWNTMTGTAYKALSGTLDMIRLTTQLGANTFDAGSINISYE